MSLLSISSASSILVACSLYFFICGLSALFLPASWLWASGLPVAVSTELRLAFGVVGAYLSALGVGAYIASRRPAQHRGVTVTLLIGNIFDFAVTLRAVVQGGLPVLNGTAFLVVTVVWTTLLLLALRAENPTTSD